LREFSERFDRLWEGDRSGSADRKFCGHNMCGELCHRRIKSERRRDCERTAAKLGFNRPSENFETVLMLAAPIAGKKSRYRSAICKIEDTDQPFLTELHLVEIFRVDDRNRSPRRGTIDQTA